MRIALIVNGKATRVTESRLAGVEEALSRAGTVDTFQTRAPRDAITLARAACGKADAIVVFSGDGGYNEVLNGLERDIPIGFVPGGGTSVLPRALGLPRDPIAAATQIAQAVEESRVRRISLGSVNGYRFAFEAGIGLDAEVVRRVDRLGRDETGRRPGDYAFIRSLVAVIRERRRELDPVLEIRDLGRAAFVVVCNGDPSTFAGPVPLRFAPAARFELGLDLTAPVRLRRRSIARLAMTMLTGHLPRTTDALYGHNLDRIEIVCDEPQPLHADGEDLGDVTSAVFECQRSAISVFV
ncbi:MAG TPA: diacylglycerol kinase family protein [Gaiellaceae bacterium]